MEKVRWSTLPFDIVTLICEEVNNSEYNFQIHYRTNTKIHAIVALASVDRRTRGVAEPFLFDRIIFGPVWESYGPERWDIAQSSIQMMLRKQSLRSTTRIFKMENLPINSHMGEVAPAGFWFSITQLLLHLRNLSYVSLNIALTSEEVLELENALNLVGPRIEDQSSPLLPVFRDAASFLGLDACFPYQRLETEDVDLEQVPRTVYFPLIRHLSVTRATLCFAKHCRNLQTIRDLGARILHNSPIDFGDTRFSSLTTVILLQQITREALLGLISTAPRLEFFVAQSPSASISPLPVEECSKLFSRFPRLRLLVLKGKIIWVTPNRVNPTKKPPVEAAVSLFGERCPSLQEVHLGTFCFNRTDSADPWTLSFGGGGQSKLYYQLELDYT